VLQFGNDKTDKEQQTAYSEQCTLSINNRGFTVQDKVISELSKGNLSVYLTRKVTERNERETKETFK
jgi:hypothetical protein